MGISRSPRGYSRVIKGIKKEWEKINRLALQRAIRKLYESKLIEGKDNADDTTTMLLTDKGKRRALTYHIDEITIPKMKKWDKRWRIVLFDIPEKYKKGRNALASILKRMGFYTFQKSVFIHPFDCKNEVDFVIEFFNLRPYVRYIIAEHIDNELHVKSIFSL